VQAIWFGSALFLLAVAAPAAFTATNSPNDAANVVGAMLTRWHYIALVAPLLLLALEWRRSRPLALVLLFVAVMLASSQALVDTRIRMLRFSSPAPISDLAPTNPIRRRFGLLHGISSLLLLGQIVVAGAVVATDDTKT
jgi:hypothetical protein